MLSKIREICTSTKKFGGDVVDLFRPKNSVEIIIRRADTGEVHKRIKGRNIVTGFLSSQAPYSGRDVMRRLLIDPQYTSSGQYYVHSVSDQRIWVANMVVGSGGNAEQASDTALDSATGESAAVQPVSQPTLDPTNTYVTFSSSWSDSEMNGYTLKEVALLSNRSTLGPSNNEYDFLARKTFQAFTKTAEFSFEVRWTLRF